MRPATSIALGASLAGLAVVAGAFGAHGLEGQLSERDLATFETAARYQMYHALALCLVGVVATGHRSRLLTAAGWCFLAGIMGFSGLLYALVFSGLKLLGAFVPLGGVAMILGWGLLAVVMWRRRE